MRILINWALVKMSKNALGLFCLSSPEISNDDLRKLSVYSLLVIFFKRDLIEYFSKLLNRS